LTAKFVKAEKLVAVADINKVCWLFLLQFINKPTKTASKQAITKFNNELSANYNYHQSDNE